MEQKTLFWLRCLAVALAYGLVYAGVRYISLTYTAGLNWIPVAGLRFSALLLVPVRYWPALVVGELMALAYQNIQCLDQFGLVWVLVASVPPMLLATPLVWLIRKRWPDLLDSLAEHMSDLLICIGLVALLQGCKAALNGSLVPKSQLGLDEQSMSLLNVACQAFMGAYLGTLAVTACVLWLVQVTRQTIERERYRWGLRQWLEYIQETRIWGVWVLLAMMAGLGLLGQHVHDQQVLIAIFGVVIVAAWFYGWQGTALVGAAANLAIAGMMPYHNDFTTLYAQAVMGLAMTGLLLFGASTTITLELAQKEQRNLQLARRELIKAEQRRAESALMLEDSVKWAHQEAIQVMHALRQTMPSKEFVAQYQRLDALYQRQQRLAVSMAPRAWLYFGGPQGQLAETLQALGLRCVIQEPVAEDNLSQVSSELGLAMYRLVCEALVYGVAHAPRQELRLSMAATRRTKTCGIVIKAQLESRGLPLQLPRSDAVAWLKAELDASGLSVQGMRYRAKLFGGELMMHEATETQGMRVTIRLVGLAQDEIYAKGADEGLV